MFCLGKALADARASLLCWLPALPAPYVSIVWTQIRSSSVIPVKTGIVTRWQYVFRIKVPNQVGTHDDVGKAMQKDVYIRKELSEGNRNAVAKALGLLRMRE